MTGPSLSSNIRYSQSSGNVSWCGHHVSDAECFTKYLQEVVRPRVSDSDLGFETDPRSRGESLSQKLVAPTRTYLFAWYLPVPIPDWSKLLQEKTS